MDTEAKVSQREPQLCRCPAFLPHLQGYLDLGDMCLKETLLTCFIDIHSNLRFNAKVSVKHMASEIAMEPSSVMANLRDV